MLSEFRKQLPLAALLATSHLGQHLMGFVDTAVLARYSESAVAAAGVANAILMGLMVLGVGIVLGLDSMLPQALGAGDRARAARILGEGLRISLGVGVAATAIALAIPALLPRIGLEPTIVPEASIYLYGRLPSIVPLLLFTAFRSFLQARGLTRPIFTAMLIGNAVNALLDILLVFGDVALTSVGLPALGLPALGVLGAALSTSAVALVTCAYLGRAVALAVGAPLFAASDRPLRRAILRLGLPIGCHLLAEVGVFALTAVLAGTLGVLPMAAHNIAITLASLSFAFVIGIGAATGTRVGQWIGQGDARRARVAGFTGMAMGGLFMSTTAALFTFFPAELARCFSRSEALIDAAVPLLQIAAVFQLSDGLQAIGAGALRGAGDNRFTLVANLIGHYPIGLTLAIWLAFGEGLGARGLWWGLSAGLTVVAVVLFVRFEHISRRPIARSDQPAQLA